MTRAFDLLNPDKSKRVLVLVCNLAVSEQTGSSIGFWWAALTHPYREFEHPYQVEVASPDHGPLDGDSGSDPRDESKCSADDLISLGSHMRLVDESRRLTATRERGKS